MRSDAAKTPTYPTLLLICCVVVLGCYFGTYMRLPVVPLFARSLGADTVRIGIINGSFLFTAGALSLPLGVLSDRLGVKLLISLGLLILAGSSFLLAWCRTPEQLIWIYLISGVGLAAVGPTIMAFVANFSPPTHLGRSYGWYTAALYTGMSLGPAVGGFVAGGLGFPPVFLISGFSFFLAFGVVCFFLPRARQVLAPPPQKPPINLAVFRGLLKNHSMMGCWLATLGGCFGFGMVVTYLPLYAQNQGLTYGQIGLVFMVQGVFNVICRLPFGHLSDRAANRSNLVVLGLVGMALSLAAFGLSSRPFHFYLGATAMGISMGLAFTSIGAITAETSPPDFRGLAMGGYNASIYLGMMLGSAVMGPVLRVLGFAETLYITTLISLGITGVFYLLMRNAPRFKPETLKPGSD